MQIPKLNRFSYLGNCNQLKRLKECLKKREHDFYSDSVAKCKYLNRISCLGNCNQLKRLKECLKQREKGTCDLCLLHFNYKIYLGTVVEKQQIPQLHKPY